MKTEETIQYTIRSIPKSLDKFLRRQARASGRSLNQIVVDYLSQAARVDMLDQEDDFSWIIGADTLDQSSLQAIADLKSTDKAKQQNL